MIAYFKFLCGTCFGGVFGLLFGGGLTNLARWLIQQPPMTPNQDVSVADAFIFIGAFGGMLLGGFLTIRKAGCRTATLKKIREPDANERA